MTEGLNEALRMLEASGWRCVKNTRSAKWPQCMAVRYPWVSSHLRDALSELKEVVSADETCWLLTVHDYAGRSDSAFAWNEWELCSLDAAAEDLEWINQIKSFWDRHLPIAISVSGGYSYYALKEDGTVVSGIEPDFEESSFVASSYAEFIAHLVCAP